MYGVVPSKQFARSLAKLERSGLFKSSARTKFDAIVNLLAQGKSLPVACKDHSLQGKLQGHRECHIKDDLLLLYAVYEKERTLILADIGTHSQLFG